MTFLWRSGRGGGTLGGLVERPKGAETTRPRARTRDRVATAPWGRRFRVGPRARPKADNSERGTGATPKGATQRPKGAGIPHHAKGGGLEYMAPRRPLARGSSYEIREHLEMSARGASTPASRRKEKERRKERGASGGMAYKNKRGAIVRGQ